MSYAITALLFRPLPACPAGEEGWSATKLLRLIAAQPFAPAGQAGRGRTESEVSL
jgi:hypothetical protein